MKGFRFCEADENESLIVKPDENSDVKWIAINKIHVYSNEPHMKKIYDKIVVDSIVQ